MILSFIFTSKFTNIFIVLKDDDETIVNFTTLFQLHILLHMIFHIKIYIKYLNGLPIEREQEEEEYTLKALKLKLEIML